LLKQLQESEAEREEGRFWRQVLNSLFSYVGILSPDGIFLEANQAILGLIIVFLIFFLPGGILKIDYRKLLAKIRGVKGA
jgi:hypothetical protein